MLPSLVMASTSAKVKPMRRGTAPPPSVKRELQWNFPFLPAPKTLEFKGEVFSWSRDDEIEQDAENLLKGRDYLLPENAFVYVYTSDDSRVLIVTVLRGKVFAVTLTALNAYEKLDFSASLEPIDSEILRRRVETKRSKLEETIKKRQSTIAALRAEIALQEQALKADRVALAEAETIPTIIALPDDAAAALRREPEPPKDFGPKSMIQRRRNRPASKKRGEVPADAGDGGYEGGGEVGPSVVDLDDSDDEGGGQVESSVVELDDSDEGSD